MSIIRSNCLYICIEAIYNEILIKRKNFLISASVLSIKVNQLWFPLLADGIANCAEKVGGGLRQVEANL